MNREEIVKIYNKRLNKSRHCSYGAFLNNWSKYNWTMEKYTKIENKAEFTCFVSPFEDDILYIKKAGYYDIELYYVIMEDAYRTPTAEILTADEVLTKYGLTIEDLTN